MSTVAVKNQSIPGLKSSRWAALESDSEDETEEKAVETSKSPISRRQSAHHKHRGSKPNKHDNNEELELASRIDLSLRVDDNDNIFRTHRSPDGKAHEDIFETRRRRSSGSDKRPSHQVEKQKEQEPKQESQAKALNEAIEKAKKKFNQHYDANKWNTERERARNTKLAASRSLDWNQDDNHRDEHKKQRYNENLDTSKQLKRTVDGSIFMNKNTRAARMERETLKPKPVQEVVKTNEPDISTDALTHEEKLQRMKDLLSQTNENLDWADM